MLRTSDRFAHFPVLPVSSRPNRHPHVSFRLSRPGPSPLSFSRLSPLLRRAPRSSRSLRASRRLCLLSFRVPSRSLTAPPNPMGIPEIGKPRDVCFSRRAVSRFRAARSSPRSSPFCGLEARNPCRREDSNDSLQTAVVNGFIRNNKRRFARVTRLFGYRHRGEIRQTRRPNDPSSREGNPRFSRPAKWRRARKRHFRFDDLGLSTGSDVAVRNVADCLRIRVSDHKLRTLRKIRTLRKNYSDVYYVA